MEPPSTPFRNEMTLSRKVILFRPYITSMKLLVGRIPSVSQQITTSRNNHRILQHWGGRDAVWTLFLRTVPPPSWWGSEWWRKFCEITQTSPGLGRDPHVTVDVTWNQEIGRNCSITYVSYIWHQEHIIHMTVTSTTSLLSYDTMPRNHEGEKLTLNKLDCKRLLQTVFFLHRPSLDNVPIDFDIPYMASITIDSQGRILRSHLSPKLILKI